MYIYLLQSGETTCYKIGVSKNINSRIKELQSGNPYPIKLVACADLSREDFREGAYWMIEQSFHGMLRDARLSGEWFDLTSRDVEIIKESYSVIETGNEEQINSLNSLWAYR
jgi:hypothetical protein